MPTLGIRQSTWFGLRQNQRDLMRWAFTKLSLGTNPALYETPSVEGSVPWFIFDDWRLDPLMYARLGTLANEVDGLPVGWNPPRNPDGTIDRAAVEAEAIARVEASIVCPDDIAYLENNGTWPQDTLDAQIMSPAIRAAMLGWLSVPAGWTVLEAA